MEIGKWPLQTGRGICPHATRQAGSAISDLGEAPRNAALSARCGKVCGSGECVAGAGGFEPPHGGIKIRCLTAWRRPNAPADRRARTIKRQLLPRNPCHSAAPCAGAAAQKARCSGRYKRSGPPRQHRDSLQLHVPGGPDSAGRLHGDARDEKPECGLAACVRLHYKDAACGPRVAKEIGGV